MYSVLRKILFLFSPERAHYLSMNALKAFCSMGIFQKIIKSYFKPAGNLAIEMFFKSANCSIVFSNPVGLGAGFDKNAKYLRELEALGFGFVEIGTVTPKPQKGNDTPRLFRLPLDKALINRMGFNNDGAEAISKRLLEWRNNQAASIAKSSLIIGGNIGKNKVTSNEDAWKDYEICFNTLFNYVDYFVVNVSSPNTPGLRELQEKDSLKKILVNLQSINKTKVSPKPILLKIAPDLTREQLDDVIDLALEIQLDGLVATNTTISRENLITGQNIINEIGNGGLSGKPVKEMSTDVVRYLTQKTANKIPVIGSGGIFNAEDAIEKFGAGASLIQVWTGFIYEGPGIVKHICRKLSGNSFFNNNSLNR